jgi:hypothetical protein
MESTVLAIANGSAEASKCAGKFVLGVFINKGYMWFAGRVTRLVCEKIAQYVA